MTVPVPPGLVTDAPPPPAPAKPPPFQVSAPEGSVLDELLSQREMAKARVDEAAQAFDILDKRVKRTLAQLLTPGVTEIDVPGTRFRKGIRMSFRRKKLTDWDRLRAEYPQIDFDSYVKWGQPYFQIDKLG